MIAEGVRGIRGVMDWKGACCVCDKSVTFRDLHKRTFLTTYVLSAGWYSFPGHYDCIGDVPKTHKQ